LGCGTFVSLESLTLDRVGRLSDDNSQAQILAARNLRRFRWVIKQDFSDPHETDHSAWFLFGREEETRLRELATQAIARRLPLERIDVDFLPFGGLPVHARGVSLGSDRSRGGRDTARRHHAQLSAALGDERGVWDHALADGGYV
jgi:hypothetical protein